MCLREKSLHFSLFCSIIVFVFLWRFWLVEWVQFWRIGTGDLTADFLYFFTDELQGNHRFRAERIRSYFVPSHQQHRHQSVLWLKSFHSFALATNTKICIQTGDFEWWRGFRRGYEHQIDIYRCFTGYRVEVVQLPPFFLRALSRKTCKEYRCITSIRSLPFFCFYSFGAIAISNRQ